MEILLEIAFGLFEFLLEIVIPLLGELLVQLGVDWIACGAKLPKPAAKLRTMPAWVAAPLAFGLGLGVGWLSMLVVPSPHTTHVWRLVLSLLVVPPTVGALMAAVGAWRRRRGAPDGRLYHFVYGTLFALAVSLMRLHF